MPKLTETEMLRHIENCKTDAAKLYKCSEKDLHVRVLKNDNVVISMKGVMRKERQE